MSASNEAAIFGYLAGLQANARILPGLLSNPLARTNWRSFGHDRLTQLLPSLRQARQTPSLEVLESTLEELLFQEHINVLVINGGDGTIHHTVNAAIRVTERASQQIGQPVPLPHFLFVNGGGMNMLARVFNTWGHPARTFARFLERTRGARFGSLPRRSVPLLSIEEADGSHRYGYIFGSEMVCNALTMYERFGQGYVGLMRLLSGASLGYLFKTDLWYRYGHMFDAPNSPLHVRCLNGEEHHFEHYSVAVATTVPMHLAGGLITAVRQPASPGVMNGLAILTTDKGEIISLIPSLMQALPSQGVWRQSKVTEMALCGPYTLDGERFDRRTIVRNLKPDLSEGLSLERAVQETPYKVCSSSRILWGIEL